VTTVRDLRQMAWPGAVVLVAIIAAVTFLLYSCVSKTTTLQQQCATEHGHWNGNGGNFGQCDFPKAQASK
jgi:hypothetical protein